MPEIADKTKEKGESVQSKALARSGVKTLKMKGEKDRETYLAWRSIPAMLRSLKEEDLKRMGYPVDDPIFMAMLSLKTKKAFCEHFKIAINQPTRWEADADFMAKVHQVSVQQNVMRFKADVDFSFTQKVMREGDAQRVKLWKQLFEGWVEKEEHRNLNVTTTPAQLVEMIEERNAKLRNNKAA